MFHVIERQYVGINIEHVSFPVLIYVCAEQDVPDLSRRDDKYLYIDHGQYKSATRAVIEARKLAEKKSNDDNRGCHLVNYTDFAIDHMAVDYRVFAPGKYEPVIDSEVAEVLGGDVTDLVEGVSSVAEATDEIGEIRFYFVEDHQYAKHVYQLWTNQSVDGETFAAWLVRHGAKGTLAESIYQHI